MQNAKLKPNVKKKKKIIVEDFIMACFKMKDVYRRKRPSLRMKYFLVIRDNEYLSRKALQEGIMLVLLQKN